MLVDPLILFVIYAIAVISLGVSFYALVMLKELTWYYEILQKRTKPTSLPNVYSTKTKRK